MIPVPDSPLRIREGSGTRFRDQGRAVVAGMLGVSVEVTR